VVEIGPGPGALTRVLYPRYPLMTALEIDQRAVAFLGEKLPGLSVRHMDVLEADWPQMAVDRGAGWGVSCRCGCGCGCGCHCGCVCHCG
jgi:16S rRNA A1518/A1519 N6-dimethyltransferase RsmA/KsgA/DIM1 with predicted DNA glycosylase/AP lyase activity